MRWIEFRAWLNRLLDSAPADVIAYEQAHHRGGAATHVAHSLIGLVEAVAAERGIEVTNRHTATIKKHALGTGKGGKPEMITAAKERGWHPDDDNEADALWLLDLIQVDFLGKP
jgi:Holliday junction resolvasome RuvABC endonuclease subunit